MLDILHPPPLSNSANLVVRLVEVARSDVVFVRLRPLLDDLYRIHLLHILPGYRGTRRHCGKRCDSNETSSVPAPACRFPRQPPRGSGSHGNHLSMPVSMATAHSQVGSDFAVSFQKLHAESPEFDQGLVGNGNPGHGDVIACLPGTDGKNPV